MFELHPTLMRDTHPIGQFDLCTLLLMNDQQYPWFILVPRRTNASAADGYVREIFELSEADQQQLVRESSRLARCLTTHFPCDKLNIAAIGNVVPQLHVHHVVRRRDDVAWPGPVWGKFAPLAYSGDDVARIRAQMADMLTAELGFQASPA